MNKPIELAYEVHGLLSNFSMNDPVANVTRPEQWGASGATDMVVTLADGTRLTVRVMHTV